MAGRQLELEVGPVAHGGHCVARHEGRVVFVRHALPGERVLAQITDGTTTSRYLRADAVEVLEPSEHRRTPPCPHAGPGLCGGCDWQHVETAHQRVLKAQVLQEQLRRLAGLDLPVTVAPVEPDEGGLRWRTRLALAVTPQGRAGLRRHRSHEIIEIDTCLIARPEALATGVLEQDHADASSVDVVVPGAGPLDAGERVPLGEIVVVDAPLPAQAPSPVVHEEVELPGGRRAFAVDAQGFWQIHPGAPRAFVAHVLAGLAPQPGERAVDLYCGVGLFAAALAQAVGPEGEVLAIEGSARAVEHARANLADLPWAQVRAGRVDRVLAPLVGQGVLADLVVLDPPRAGAGREVVEQVAALRPSRVAYVACDPAALARDLATFASLGYRVRSVQGFDAFGQTQHLEAIALLSRVEGEG